MSSPVELDLALVVGLFLDLGCSLAVVLPPRLGRPLELGALQVEPVVDRTVQAQRWTRPGLAGKPFGVL